MRGCTALLLFFFFISLHKESNAQRQIQSNLRTKTIENNNINPTSIDSFYVLPATVLLFEREGKLIDSSYYYILDNKIHWQKKLPVSSFPLTLSYRILPYQIDTPLKRLDTILLSENPQENRILNPYSIQSQGNILRTSGINSSGSFARSLSFGNNQDLVLNSRFNLQMAGLIGDVELNAAITDENIPIQPEGNTQNLREFDKIFISLKKDKSKLIAGDYELGRPESYFMNYFKKLQGVSLYHESPLTSNIKQRSDLSLAISRGKFARNFINQQEGNQGPYQLNGAENERFIIILSGTEKVWLDGVILTRGIDQDYIIDYNRGEITFTSKRIITKDSRILVEFEYTDQQYLRTLVAFNSSLAYKERFQLNFFFFSQQDSKNPSRTLQLTETEKSALQLAGDNLNNNVFTAVDTILDVQPAIISYILKDTFVSCNNADSVQQIFVLNVGNELAPALDVQFSFVGEGLGNYVLDNNLAANELVFKWVAPDPLTCRSRGNYSPNRPLTAPQQQSITAINARWLLHKNSQLNMEAAISNLDLNRFSSLDQDDDAGLAFTLNWENEKKDLPATTDIQMNSSFRYEFKSQFFQPLNPYRNREFLRDWSIADKQNLGTPVATDEHFIQGRLSFIKSKYGQLEFTSSFFNRSGLYSGFRQGIEGNYQGNGWLLTTNSSWLIANAIDDQRTFLRPNLKITKSLGKVAPWRVSVSAEMEQNARLQTSTDTLTGNSFGFDWFRFQLESPTTEKKQFQFNISQRRDFQPRGSEFELQTNAIDANINGLTNIGRRGSLKATLSYRDLIVQPTADLNTTSGSTFLGRVDNRLAFWKGALRSSTTYELGSGQEPRRSFTFIRVARGEGTHIWLDSLYNNDGIIQVNEMEIAPFRDRADFVRVATFSSEFIRTDFVNLNQSININPKALWFNKKGVKKLLSLFALQSNLRIARKTQKDANINIWNPFDLPLSDSSLISTNAGTRQQLFFNRGNSKFDLQFGRLNNRSKILQTTGFESRSQTSIFAKTRWNIFSRFNLETEITTSENQTLSELATNRNFTLEELELVAEVNYLIDERFRIGASYSWKNSENIATESDPASAFNHEIKIEATYNEAAAMALRLDFSYINVNFSGNSNTPVGFAILNGLQLGQNFLWQLNLDRQLSNNLQMSVGYEGRKTGQARIIHVGRAQITALF